MKYKIRITSRLHTLVDSYAPDGAPLDPLLEWRWEVVARSDMEAPAMVDSGSARSEEQARTDAEKVCRHFSRYEYSYVPVSGT